MTFLEIKKEMTVALYMTKVNFYNEAALRGAFLLQVFGMFLNDFAFLFVWVFFFKAFGSINGWGTNETFALQGIAALAYGLCFTFAGGIGTLPKKVHTGSLDSLLLSPRSLYIRIATSMMHTSAIGDTIFGIGMLVAYTFLAHLSGLQIVMLITLIIPATLIFMSTHMMANLISLFIPDSDLLARNIFELVLTPSLYPAALYQGLMRFIFFFGIPALAIAGVPVEVVRDLNPLWYGLIWLIAIVWLFLTNWALGSAMKRYESGNLIGSRD